MKLLKYLDLHRNFHLNFDTCFHWQQFYAMARVPMMVPEFDLIEFTADNTIYTSP